jgi:hypothetical protein
VANIVIKRCPVCPTIRARTQEAMAVLRAELSVQAHIQDGATGEFTVLADGVPMLQRTGDSLPSTEEVLAAVRNASTVASR